LPAGVKKFFNGLLVDRVVKEALYDIPADEMVLHDFGRPLFIDVRVPRSFGIDDHVGPVAALSQASTEGDLDPTLEGVLHKIVLQRLQRFLGAVLTASGTGADEKMMSVKTQFSPR
jgi:hypothetical protein